jgi:hypothetical protein
MVLGEVFAQTGAVGCPIDFEVTVGGTVGYPEKAHVDGFVLLLLEGTLNDSISSGIASLRFCGWLGIANFFEGGM